MSRKSPDSAFGMTLSRYLLRNPHLTRDQLASGINQDPAVITDMCKGRRLTGLQARQRVLHMIAWLREHRVLFSLEEADALLIAADMAPLDADRPAEAALWRAFNEPDLLEPHSEAPVFTISYPITVPKRFYGRSRILDRLFDLWRDGLQHVIVLGPRYSGKTSLLYYLKRLQADAPARLRPDQGNSWSSRAHQIRWIYVDFRNPNMGNAAYLLRYLLQRMGMPAPRSVTLDAFIATVSAQLHSPTIILFDEVGIARERYHELGSSFWDGLSSLAQTGTHQRLGYVLTAESPLESPVFDIRFFGINGYLVYLGPFEVDEARQLIASSPIPFSEEDIEWILETSNLWPLPLQILCHERLSALQSGEQGTLWRNRACHHLALYHACFSTT
ncbi:ATP-binding protein [Roseiflexus sp.]|uniref:ATP-binding protein n=1 Tax=Roseiflexus sp. TaxID=2562120 RepID=UPI00398B2286